MKLLIFSDSHGNVANMEDVVRLESPDRILHLGDLARDAQEPEERVFTLDGCKILMTHGHIYHVKMGMGMAIRAAREAGAHLLCFGHTHEAFCEFENGLWIVNPGSVGTFGPHTYAVAVLEDGGAVCYLSQL